MTYSIITTAFAHLGVPSYHSRTKSIRRRMHGLVLALTMLLTVPAFGQATESTSVDATYASRSVTFWKALEKQFEGQVALPLDRVSATTLQNIVYFAAQHADRIDLRSSLPGLVAVYRNHPDVRYRTMAVAAIHAIGDRWGMYEVHRGFRSQTEPTLRHITLAALRDHYGSDKRSRVSDAETRGGRP